MADVPRVKLSELVGRFGTGLSGDARRSKALLADVCGDQFRGECAVLVAAVEEGVARELLSSSSGLPEEVLLDRLSRRLQTNRGVSSDLARWSVESWAVALGVVAGGNTLATFKMDGLMPLIDLAGADGAISAAELDQLILEAKTRGVSETEARAYLTKYAASRGWQLGAPAGSTRARRRASPAPTAPSPLAPASPQSPPPGPSFPQPAPDRTFRWIAASVVGLFAIAIIVVLTRVNEHPQLPPPQPAPAPVPAPAPGAPAPTNTPSPDALKQQQADREQRAYNAARGNIPALQVYLSSCTVCAFASDTRSEIAKLQTADQEERTYNTSRGNKYALQAYLNTCTICTYGSAARSEIAALEAAQTKRRAGSAVICGRPVDYVVDATDIGEPLRSFLGVWTGAAWNLRRAHRRRRRAGWNTKSHLHLRADAGQQFLMEAADPGGCNSVRSTHL